MNDSVRKKIDLFFSRAKSVTLKKGAFLIRADEEETPFIYYINRGLVKQTALSEKGDEIILHVFKPDSLLPLILAMNKFTNHYNFETMGNVSVRRMPSEKVIEFIKNDNEVLYELTLRFGKGLNTMLLNTEFFSTNSAKTKVLAGLLLCAQRYGVKYNGGILVKLPVTHRDLGNFMGLSRETVTREIDTLVKKKVLRKTRNYLIFKDIGKILLEPQISKLNFLSKSSS